jgi:hypothetical protein
MKLTMFCDPEGHNNHECNDKVIEDEKTFDCECWCHKDPEFIKKLINEKAPKLTPYGFR